MVNTKANNLRHITEKVYRKVDLSKGDVKKVLDEFLNETEKSLKKGESINFIGYFSLSTRRQPAREMVMRFGKDKGKKKKIAAKIVPVCKFSAALKKRITSK
jgi:nucleoid DNA-binding protein